MTPTAVVRMADAGDLFVTWRWDADAAAPGVGIVPEDQVSRAVRELSAALPDPRSPGGTAHALTSGALAVFESELALAQQLSSTFLPYELAVQLHDMMTRGVRPRLRVQPSPRVAQVPWELLAPDPDVRLLDIADISALAPRSLVHAPGRTARRWADAAHLPVAAILDPKVPGFRANSALGSVLGRMSGSSSLASRVESYRAAGRFVPTVADALDAFRRTDTDREWLGAALRGGVGRLIYVGHVTAAPPAQGRGEQAEMHLSCTESTLGFATPVRGHRPLSAMDLLLGTTGLATSPVAGRELWPIPSRVALIACESGGDLRFTEALGLVAAMVHGGAELVTATRWPLPTDHAFRLFAGTDHTPLHDAVLAVDAAHEQTDALAHLAAWQRARLHAWRTTRSPADSPVLWAAFTTVTT